MKKNNNITKAVEAAAAKAEAAKAAWRKKTGMTDEEAWKVLVDKLDARYHGFKEKLMSYTERSTNLDLYIVHTLASYPDFEDKFNVLIDCIAKKG